jgi:hypothetical protein
MHALLFLTLGAWTLSVASADTNEPKEAAPVDRISGYVSGEGRLFFHDPLFPGQQAQDASLAAQLEYYHPWRGGSALTFTPFVRVDSADPERTHWDIRELNYLYPYDDGFFRFGVARVFWGSTEFVHLVDIVNQTDWIEHLDGEDKLGQPMIEFSMTQGWGTVDILALPYFRERTFPGRKGRLRSEIVVDTDDAIFRSPSRESNFDFVVRYSRSLGSLDFGLYVFRGTGRTPLLVPSNVLDPGAPGPLRLIPFYEQMTQVGTDLQWATGNWLWKLEALYHSGYLDPYFAATGGFEYTFWGVAGSKTDVGVLAEYAYDQRGDDITTTSLFDNDLFLGMRLTPNDVASTQWLAGIMQDLGQSESVLSIEASRRFGSHWRLTMEAWFFLSTPENSLIYDLRGDEFFSTELAYYF